MIARMRACLANLSGVPHRVYLNSGYAAIHNHTRSIRHRCRSMARTTFDVGRSRYLGLVALVSAMVDEQLHCTTASSHSSEIESAPVVRVGRVDIDSRSQQRFYHLEVVVRRGQHQWRAFVLALVHVDGRREELLQRLQRAACDRPVKRLPISVFCFRLEMRSSSSHVSESSTCVCTRECESGVSGERDIEWEEVQIECGRSADAASEQ